MAHVVVILGLYLVAGCQASDIEDHSQHMQQDISGESSASYDSRVKHSLQHAGFLSKYMLQRLGSDASVNSLGGDNEFTAPNFKHMNHGDRYGVPKPLAGISKAESAAKDDSQRWALQMLLGLPAMAQSHDSQTFTSVRQEPKPMPSPTWPTVSDSAKVVEKHDDHKLPYTDNVPIGLTTICIALLTFAMMIGNRVRRHLRPSAFLASNDASEFGRSSSWAVRPWLSRGDCASRRASRASSAQPPRARSER